MAGREAGSMRGRRQSPPRTVGLALARATRWAVPLAVLVGVAVGYVESHLPPTYAASTTLLAYGPSRADASLGLLALPAVDPRAFRAAVMEGPVARDAFVASNGRAPSASELRVFRRRIRVDGRAGQNSSLVRVACRAGNPGTAGRCASAVADALIRWDRNRGTRALKRSIAALQGETRRISATLAAGSAGGRPLSAADRLRLSDQRQTRAGEVATAQARLASAVPVSTLAPLLGGAEPPRVLPRHPAERGAAAAASSLVLAWLFASLAYLAGRARRARPSLAAALDLPLLGRLPAVSRNGGVAAETIDLLAFRIQHAARAADSLALAVTSLQEPSARQGVAVALATSLARTGHGVLLVDADLREGRLTRQLAIPQAAAVPLEWHLEHPRLDNSPTIVHLNARRSCDFVPSFGGVAHAPELLSRGLEACLEKWRRRYGFVLLDCPSLLPYADMLTVAPLCAGVLVCAHASEERSTHRYKPAPRPVAASPQLTGLILTHAARPARRSRARRAAPRGT